MVDEKGEENQKKEEEKQEVMVWGVGKGRRKEEGYC